MTRSLFPGLAPFATIPSGFLGVSVIFLVTSAHALESPKKPAVPTTTVAPTTTAAPTSTAAPTTTAPSSQAAPSGSAAPKAAAPAAAAGEQQGTASVSASTKSIKAGDKKAGDKKAGDSDIESTEVVPSLAPGKKVGLTASVGEDPNTWHYFVGARYRANIVPKFWVNAFVSEGSSIFSNTVGIEGEARKDGLSLVLSLNYTEFGTDSMLFLQKGRSTTPGNYSLLNSSLKMFNAEFNVLWSKRLHRMLDFEYGLGVSLGMTFGDMVLNWVHEDANGAFTAETGKRYAPCVTGGQQPGCGPQDHSNSPVNKVGTSRDVEKDGYREPSWFNGGSKPSLLGNIYLPMLGLRFKPNDKIAARLQTGFSITAFWFGLSVDYEVARRKGEPPASDAVEAVETVE
jgi:hypothetical protein